MSVCVRVLSCGLSLREHYKIIKRIKVSVKENLQPQYKFEIIRLTLCKELIHKKAVNLSSHKWFQRAWPTIWVCTCTHAGGLSLAKGCFQISNIYTNIINVFVWRGFVHKKERIHYTLEWSVKIFYGSFPKWRCSKSVLYMATVIYQKCYFFHFIVY